MHQIKIPACYAGNVDQADFYRRGWLDAKAGREPASMHGYAPVLKLAYAQGGIDATATDKALASDREDLRAAYRASRLKRDGIGMLEAMNSPAIAAGLSLHARVIADRRAANNTNKEANHAAL